jgi:hypothetical protein
MVRILSAILAFMITASLGWAANPPPDSPDDAYFAVTHAMEEADTLQAQGKTDAAKAKYQAAEKELKEFRTKFPGWNNRSVQNRLQQVQKKLAAVENPAPAHQPNPSPVQANPAQAKRKDPNDSAQAKVGKPAPEIEGEDVEGKKFKLSDYRGKVVMIDFWGDW